MLENLAIASPEIRDFPSEIQESRQPEGELYLRFYLPSGAEFALPAVGIKEVMQQPVDKIASVPNASPLLIGAINLRGRVIWVADLGKFLGYDGELSGKRGEIPTIVIDNQDTILALAVGRLGNMEWLDSGQLRQGTNLPDTIAPYVEGEWAIEGTSQPALRILDHSAILQSARWAA
jgi:twitching motility protein PilI